MTCAGYLQPLFKPANLRRIVMKMCIEARRIRRDHSFGALAFTGQSGAAVAWPMSMALDIPVLAVRKNGECRHSLNLVEAPNMHNLRSYLIVDDCIETGATIREIIKAINNTHYLAYACPQCIGVLLWNGGYCSTKPSVLSSDGKEIMVWQA